MKHIFTLLFTALLCANAANSQDTLFQFSPKGLTDYLVINCDSISQSELYKKVLYWVQITYKNPNEVLKSQIENDFIRIEGAVSDIYCINSLGTKMCYTTRYVVEISVKAGKYKFDVLSMDAYLAATGWYSIPLDDTKGDMYYNKKGELKATYKYMDQIPDYFNLLNQSLKDYVRGKNNSQKGNW